MLSVRQAGNPSFAFLSRTDRLHPYFRWLVRNSPQVDIFALACDRKRGWQCLLAVRGVRAGSAVADWLSVETLPVKDACGCCRCMTLRLNHLRKPLLRLRTPIWSGNRWRRMHRQQSQSHNSHLSEKVKSPAASGFMDPAQYASQECMTPGVSRDARQPPAPGAS